MKIKTSGLTGAALDWAVAKCEGFDSRHNYEVELFDHEIGNCSQLFFCFADDDEHAKEQAENAYPDFDVQHVTELGPYKPSVDWAQGGPIIEREKLSVELKQHGYWMASRQYNYADEKEFLALGDTPLVAAMRCYVASKLGDGVDVPEELT